MNDRKHLAYTTYQLRSWSVAMMLLYYTCMPSHWLPKINKYFEIFKMQWSRVDRNDHGISLIHIDSVAARCYDIYWHDILTKSNHGKVYKRVIYFSKGFKTAYSSSMPSTRSTKLIMLWNIYSAWKFVLLEFLQNITYIKHSNLFHFKQLGS